MKEPFIQWQPLKFRKQEKYQCVPNAIARLMEKLAQIKGVDLDVDEKELAKHLRDGLRDHKGGISTRGALLLLRQGWKGMKLYYTFYKKTKYIHTLLKKRPLLLSIKTYKRKGSRVRNGRYKMPTKEKKGGHLVLLLGYDGDWIIQDSNYLELVRMSEKNLEKRLKKVYLVRAL